MSVVVIDYGMSNLGSISQALEQCGGDVLISTDPKDLETASHIILPGVGAFRDGMKNLVDLGWVPAIKKAAIEDKVPFLGICLGMQLLADKGYEMGETDGLGLIPGEVKKLKPKSDRERIPHVGWNEVYPQAESLIFAGIPEGTDFYFVHSYHFIAKKQASVLSTTPYCGQFVSGVWENNIYGTQFHPEKSSRPGFALLRNFLSL